MSTRRALKFKKTFKKYSHLQRKWTECLKHFKLYEYYLKDMSNDVSEAFYYYINGVESLEQLDESNEELMTLKHNPTSLIALDSLNTSIIRMDKDISNRLEKTKTHMRDFFRSHSDEPDVQLAAKSHYNVLPSPFANTDYNVLPDEKQNILNRNITRRTNVADIKRDILKNTLFYFEKYRTSLNISSNDVKLLRIIIKQHTYIVEFFKPLYPIVNELHSLLKSKVETKISLYDYALLFNLLSNFNILKKTLLEYKPIDALLDKIIQHIRDIRFELNKGNKTVFYRILNHFD